MNQSLVYTPGEWKAQRYTRRHKGMDLRLVRVQSTTGHIVADHTGIHTSRHEPDETFGNACLMASAPRAYVACAVLVNWIDKRNEQEPGWIDRQAGFLKQAYFDAKAALKIAEGRDDEER